MHTSLQTVTPRLARQWLDVNFNNRPFSRAYVEELPRALRSGQFRTTHQGLAFDTQGRLRDGQHRLTAIVETGIAAEMLVSTGLTETELQAIDDGRRRTAQQVLSMLNEGGVSHFTTAIARELLSRRAHHERKTRETDISIDVDLDAYLGNVRQIRRDLPASVRLLEVIKDNAYGMGAARIARLGQTAGAADVVIKKLAPFEGDRATRRVKYIVDAGDRSGDPDDVPHDAVVARGAEPVEEAVGPRPAPEPIGQGLAGPVHPPHDRVVEEAHGATGATARHATW